MPGLSRQSLRRPRVCALPRDPSALARSGGVSSAMTVGLSYRSESQESCAGDRLLPGALTTDLTSNGACVCLPAEEDLLGSELELRWPQFTAVEGAYH